VGTTDAGFAGLLMLAVAACSTSTRSLDGPRRPNVVILYTDDQGYGDCGALNPHARFVTPHIDRLAAEGVSFTDAHSADAVCSPSRYALLTGRYAWRTRLKRGVLGADDDCLIRDEPTIARLLKANGYRTGIVGKWHLGMQIPGTKGERDWAARVTDGPLTTGFDTFYGIPASMNFGALTWFDGGRATAPASMWTRKKFPTAEITVKPLDYRMAPPYDAERQGRGDVEVAPSFADVDVLRIIAERSVAFIEAAAREPERPFFLYVPFTSPHLPHCTAPEFRGKSTMGNYGDFMLETDARVGQILAALDRHGFADDTLVVFSSDNGPENNRRDWSRIYGHESSGGFRGGKRDLYEGGHRVPFFVRWPDVVLGGQLDSTPICQTDVFATIAEIVGANLPDSGGVDSFSFLPRLIGDEGVVRAPIIHHSGAGRFAIRSGRHKLLLGEGELYDLAADPAETTDIIEAHPEIVSHLRSEATAIVLRGRSTPGPALANDGPAWWPRLDWIPKEERPE